MDLDQLGTKASKWVQETLGYLNFSSGATDPAFLVNLNELFGLISAESDGGQDSRTEPVWETLKQLLQSGLSRLHGSSSVFRQTDQARSVIRLVFEELLSAYRGHHRDLLFHQTDEALFQPFFIGRACEAVLSEGGPWEQTDRIVRGALKRLNVFIGHRPVAVLETRQRLQPYPNEWVRPLPLFIEGAGTVVGPYCEVVEEVLGLFGSTDPMLLDRAWFDPGLMEELAVDPRAFDFDHPVNLRPNYHFGGWDPHYIDNKGRYRRFVLQQVTLDGLMSRITQRADLPREEVLFEAAAVLAGTMLMGSGVSGNGPDAHDSGTSLASLLPTIAGYRDEFYERLIDRLPRRHAKRLQAEAGTLRQPFGGARQHLNRALAQQRARQLQHVHLARLFARMGYTEAASRQARVVPVASARMRCEIDCRLTTAHLQVDRGRLEEAAPLLSEIEDLLHRAIECGAMVDPWNILGFGARFSLFPALENSVHDHRVDDLIDLMNEIFGLYARLEKEAAASQSDLRTRLSDNLGRLAAWWDQFASTEVSDVDGISGRNAWESASQVAEAIGAWCEGGTAAGDVAFWREHVRRFNSPEAFALLVEALLEQGDLVAAMALLTFWLSLGDEIPLAEGTHSFHALAVRWMEELWRRCRTESDDGQSSQASAGEGEEWPLCRKFIDFLEANAESYWEVPRLDLTGVPTENGSSDLEQEDDHDSLFNAAYENVTYRDTTDDGFDGEILEGGPQASDFELSLEGQRISDRLAFLVTLSRLWKLAAAASTFGAGDKDRQDVLSAWLSRTSENSRRLAALLGTVYRYRIPSPGTALEAMIEYDRRRGIKEMLLERIITTCVETQDAGRFIRATVGGEKLAAGQDDWELPGQRVAQALFRADADGVANPWPDLLDDLVEEPLLYVPISRGGNPQRVVASRSIQRFVGRLLAQVPRLGLLTETFELIETVHDMEQSHAVGPGAVTEFDRLFEIGCEAIVQCLVTSSDHWPPAKPRGRKKKAVRSPDLQLVDCLEEATEPLLRVWLEHSRKIRISVLESVTSEPRWEEFKDFIHRYGHDLFTQQFMNLGNLRAILQQGADAYLRMLEEEDFEERPLLLEDIKHRLPRQQAAQWLELAIEAVVENYSRYIDYNSTTTQSDRGEMLFTLMDFLRLEASYNRVAWNLKPVVVAHDVLIRRGRDQAARTWQRAVSQRTAGVAEEHLERFEHLCGQYGMRLSSVGDRLGERFVQPLAIDRLCALVEPAVEELRQGRPTKSFKRLEQALAEFTEEPSGVGFDVPSWLESLENAAQRVKSRPTEEEEVSDPSPQIPEAKLSLKDIRRQIGEWGEIDEDEE